MMQIILIRSCLESTYIKVAHLPALTCRAVEARSNSRQIKPVTVGQKIGSASPLNFPLPRSDLNGLALKEIAVVGWGTNAVKLVCCLPTCK